MRTHALHPWAILTRRNLAGEVCYEWQTWSEYLNIRWIFVQSLLQSSIYVLLAVRYSPTLKPDRHVTKFVQIAFAASAAVLVKAYAP